MNRKLLWGFIALALLFALTNIYTPASAGALALPPRPTPALTVTHAPQVGSVTGSAIRLQADTVLPGLWTTVEWQDRVGNWHVVGGWQGTLDDDHIQTWWVAQADWGKGPFRWVVYLQRGGQLWGSSQAFYLPTANRQIVQVKATAIH